MNFAAIVSGIFAIAKAVPVVAKYIDKFYNLYIDKQLETLDKKNIKRKHKRSALMNAIKKAKTDDERKVLSSILADID